MAAEQVIVIRQTEKYKIQQDSNNNTRICDLKAGCTTTWYTYTRAQEQINHIKRLDDVEFDKMGEIKITLWVKSKELVKFLKEWDYLFNNRAWYKSGNKFQYKGAELYTEKMMGDFSQIQVDVKDYNFWLIKTKDEKGA